MNKHLVTFRLDASKKKELDALAAGMDRDRSFVINEAVETYLDMQRWQLEHIKEGVRQADAGSFVNEANVAASFKKWRR